MHLPAPTRRLALVIPMGLAMMAGVATTRALPTFAQQTMMEDGVSANFTDQVTLTAIPPRLGDEEILKADPGERIQTTVRIRNSSDQEVPIITSAEDFIIADDGFTPVPVTDDVSNRWSLAKWITLSPTEQTLAPGATATINVLIDVPADALPGGHYAMIVHQPAPSAGQTAEGALVTESAVGQRLGTLIYFMVNGPINEEAFIRGFEFQNFSEYGPVPYKFTVENMSDIHIHPQIGIEIFNIFGRRVDTISVESRNVFPLMSRNFEGQWNRVWGIGPYTAKLTMSFGQQGGVVMASTRFWLIPVKLVAAVGVILLAVLTALLMIRRHMIHRKRDEQGQIQMLQQKVQELENSKSQTPPSDSNTQPPAVG